MSQARPNQMHNAENGTEHQLHSKRHLDKSLVVAQPPVGPLHQASVLGVTHVVAHVVHVLMVMMV